MKLPAWFPATHGMALQIAMIVVVGTLLFHGTLSLALFVTHGRDAGPPDGGALRSMLQILAAVPPAERASVVAAFPGASLGPCVDADPATPPGSGLFPLSGGDCVAWHDPGMGAPGRELVPVAIVLGSVAVLLPLLLFWTARRVIAPLARLADSAQRLGQSGEADFLAEEGPEEIRRVASTYNTMQRQIQGLIAERTRMLAALSHDVRTILTRLRLRLENVADAEIQEKGLRDIQIMNDMVSSTLAFAEGLEQREELQWVDLSSILETLCDEYADLDFPVTYRGPGNVRYACRPKQLSRGLRNLIDNAVKYGGAARVTLHLAIGGGVEITVEDDGPGIPEAEQERVFEPFYRLDAARNIEKGGNGLGLTILRTAVTAHGGRIRLANREAGGLAVTVCLPEAA